MLNVSTVLSAGISPALSLITMIDYHALIGRSQQRPKDDGEAEDIRESAEAAFAASSQGTWLHS
jgi:hypothetical protein